jgi:hypothetical protein
VHATAQQKPAAHPHELGGAKPPAWSLAVSRAIRRLPPRVVRILLILDLALLAFPFWAWLFIYRWTGRRLGLRASIYHYFNGWRFVLAHLRHTDQGTGPFSMDWSAPPVRGCTLPQAPAYEPKGSCGTCRNCCTTHWLPEEKRVSCNFLVKSGCSIYGGLYWDYFNCGRYPAQPMALASYSCPRFAGAFDRKPVLRMLPVVQVEPAPAEAA